MVSPVRVCGMNLDLMTGLVDSVEQSRLSATLVPAPGRCCVTLTGSDAEN